MLAKRGKIIKNIEIPKTTTSTNSHSNNLNHNNPLHLQTNDSENILTGMGMISATNLDFLNT